MHLPSRLPFVPSVLPKESTLDRRQQPTERLKLMMERQAMEMHREQRLVRRMLSASVKDMVYVSLLMCYVCYDRLLTVWVQEQETSRALNVDSSLH